MPIATYLERKGVVGEPIPADKVTDLTVTFPTPPGWKPFVNSNLSPGTRVIAKGNTYPTAWVVVFKLNGDFDVNEAIQHGYVDAELSENFKRLNASTDNFKGFPSSMIEGSYDLNGARMHSYNRIVIATGAPPKPNVAGQAARQPAVSHPVHGDGLCGEGRRRGARHRGDHQGFQRRAAEGTAEVARSHMPLQHLMSGDDAGKMR